MEEKLMMTLSRTFNAPKAKVWEALTTPSQIKKYLFGTETISEWKAGSPIVFRGVWEGKSYEDKGTILEIEKEQTLKYNYWSNFSGDRDEPANYSIITYGLSEVNGTTVFTLTQDNFKSREARDHSEKNWGMIMETLRGMVETNA
jgi:uncharacterized protein YndB with AHSA1/START domain